MTLPFVCEAVLVTRRVSEDYRLTTHRRILNIAGDLSVAITTGNVIPAQVVMTIGSAGGRSMNERPMASKPKQTATTPTSQYWVSGPPG
ncbi:hypothetical protein CA85_48080 [Allorhodopirellula solitaria]|uniref:Uncharacterized protein n=1 Tax=Allorhodopirellula solitaria TaxID=2527987 RepID=A0A5C5WYN9_9BACT|nr:hypothetical protein CA85_48080 [Allorhodopirellula solitaria]